MNRVVFAGALLFISAFLFSCRKIEKLSPVPSIKFTSFQVFDTIDKLGNEDKVGRLKFYFEDGDGDLGLEAPIDITQDSTNLFFKLYRVTGGKLVPAASDDILKPSDYRIPYMERLGQNKILRGTISVTFLYLFYSPTDSIEYEFYIKDRAEHISNTITTCEISLGTNGICTNN